MSRARSGRPYSPDSAAASRSRGSRPVSSRARWAHEVSRSDHACARLTGRVARVALWRSRIVSTRVGPRPWVVCVHGALMGRGSVDLRLFRARHLHEQLGLNVLLPVMPLHGPRKN